MSNRASHRLVMLPGLGADEALFAPQKPAFPSLETPPWLDPIPGETLRDFAGRMAGAIRPSDHLILGGVSFGGMVAIELARHLKPSAIVLIASCTSGRAIPAHLRALARAAIRVPTSSFKPPRRLWPLVAWGFGAHSPSAQRLIYHFLETRSPAFVQWGLGALLDWTPEAPPQCPVFHIHGAADRLIPARRVTPNTVVANAGHLVNVTHADAVNDFMKEALARTDSRPRP